MPKAPQVAPLDMEEQWMSELLTLSKPLLGKPLVSVISFPQSLLFMTIGDRKTDWLINWELFFLAQLSFHHNTPAQNVSVNPFPFLIARKHDSCDTWTPTNLPWPEVSNPSFSNREPWLQTQRCWSSSQQLHTQLSMTLVWAGGHGLANP